MASDPKCPHCGSDCLYCEVDLTEWKCGSYSRNYRSVECKDRELANLRSQNRDLQQAYDHVLECEQNRCREVVELQDQLKEVTSERDEERENSRILRASRDEETAIADAWMRKCNELEQQLDELRSRFRPLPNLQRQSTPTNCFRACVAMVLGLPIGDVPEACDGASWDWDEFQRWMSDRGMQAIEVAFENGGTLYPVSSPVPCIVTGQSPRESTTGLHAVVGRFIGLAGFELVGDPHPSDLWIDGEPTHAVFFVPLWPTVISDRDELRRRIDEAPVWYMENGGFVSEYAASFRTDKQRLTRVRLVRDDQPGEANA